ncbi:MAG: ZIP family metal transporter, partial [Giesbergeria sp.]
MIFIVIVFATLAAGIGSVWVAALLMRAGLGSSSDGVGPRHLLSLAAGALLLRHASEPARLRAALVLGIAAAALYGLGMTWGFW